MAKKLFLMSGVITIAAMTAAAVTFFLVGKTNLLDKWELDLEDGNIIL